MVSWAATADSLANVIITTLPSNGTLYYNNGTTLVAVTAGQVISAADIASGKLTFTPNTDAHSDSFQFKVQESFFMPDQGPNPALVNVTTNGMTSVPKPRRLSQSQSSATGRTSLKAST